MGATHLTEVFSANSVYIGRAGKNQIGVFGSPYHVGAVCSRCMTFHRTAGSTIPCFKAYFEERCGNDAAFRKQVLSLRGRALWCPGNCKIKKAPCHGEVIIAWIEASA